MSTKLFALSFLLALAASRPTVSERGVVNTECWQTKPGTVFYDCANGYKGCFTKDPCSLPPLSSTVPVFTNSTSTKPASTKPASTSPPSYNSTIPVSTKPASATPSPSNPVVNTECWRTNPGTVFYNCANGYKGCFSKDPCSLPPLSSTSPVSTKPASTVPSTSCTQPQAQSFEMVDPRSFNIYHADAEKRARQDQVPHVDLNKPAGSNITTTNAIVFDNVPVGAKNCRLNWRSVANGGDLRFIVDGEGQAFTRQLLGFPVIGQNVSDDSLAKFRDPNAKWSPSLDFTGWTDMPGSHAGPAVKCASQVAVEVKGSDCGQGENRVQLSIAEKSGFYLTYDL